MWENLAYMQVLHDSVLERCDEILCEDVENVDS